MSREAFLARLRAAWRSPLAVSGNFAIHASTSHHSRQQQTNESFSAKWQRYEHSEEKERLYAYQRSWYLSLYGFASEEALRTHLRGCQVVFDAGCGLGYKAAWFARLAPDTLVVGMDFSEAAQQAAGAYLHLPNLFFMQGDIATTDFADGAVDYASCDQVIMHTENPERTLAELARIIGMSHGEVACYFYAKKALPRELLDEHFRRHCSALSRAELWEMAEQLAELGRRLSALNVQFDAPDVPQLGIKAGRYDLQRFIHWNFLKCFWNEELGRETSVVTNFDWYSPSNARRFSVEEVRDIVRESGLREKFFHTEEACYSGRFVHAPRSAAPACHDG